MMRKNYIQPVIFSKKLRTEALMLTGSDVHNNLGNEAQHSKGADYDSEDATGTLPKNSIWK